jgi:hypothetical protein
VGGEGGSREKGGGIGKGGEMTQPLYAHMNKRNKKIVITTSRLEFVSSSAETE